MTKMIDILEDYLTRKKYTFFRLDGSCNISDRRDMVDEFQTNPDIFAFILSTIDLSKSTAPEYQTRSLYTIRDDGQYHIMQHTLNIANRIRDAIRSISIDNSDWSCSSN